MTAPVRLQPHAMPAPAEPPSNVEAEAAFLGAALIANEIFDQEASRLSADDFHEPAHSRIFETIARLRAEGATATPVTLRPHLGGDPYLRELGGLPYLARLTADGQGLLSAPELAEQISELAYRRRRHEWHAAGMEAAADISQPLTDLEPPARSAKALGLKALDLAELAQIEPQPKAFTIPKVAPASEVTLFTGPGAVGKSLLAQQLCTARAAGRRAIGLDQERGAAIYITCEDDAEQLHFRQAKICAQMGIGMSTLAGRLHLVSLRGQPDNALAVFGTDGRLSPRPLYHAIAATIRETGAGLVALDNVAHLFTGNENDRGEVTQFVNLLNRLAGESGAAILLLGHPNKAGDSYSGSTAWLNAVRSQVFLSRPDGDGEDPDVRILTIGKPNYSAAGETIRFRWHDWAFVLEDELPDDQRAQIAETIRAASDNATFMACLTERTRQQRAVSERRSATFAPTVFAGMPESKGIGAKRLEAAMDRLFRLGKIERAELWRGPDRKPVYGLREAAGNGAGDGAGNGAGDARETVP